MSTVTILNLERSMPPEKTDQQLVDRIRAGDENALQALYEQYGPRLYAHALHMTNDPALAEDVLQESLVAIWQGAHRYRQDGRLIAWLLGIVTHKALNAMRGRVIDSEESIAEWAAPGPLPDEISIAREREALLRAGLQRLPPEQRTVLELVFYQGLPLQEVAQACHIPVGTVKSRLNYAKAILRGLLSREGIRWEDLK
ncbi:MAG: RNA polymerase sigma factor [Anaerolineaceae bacterium]|nr:RNA polymerase sigma factor [Anaerolineaceae bacterium]